MGDLATKSKQATGGPPAGPVPAPPQVDDAAERLRREQAAEEAASRRAEAGERAKAGKASSRFNAALGKVGFESDIGKAEDAQDQQDEELETSREAGGGASFRDGPEAQSLEGENEDDEEKLGVSTDKRNLKVEQEGLLGGVGSASVGKDGIAAGDIEIADGWKGGLSLGPGQQKAEFKAPTGLKFPPPKGLELDLVDLKFPLGPGFGIDVGVGIKAKLEIDDVALALEHRSAETGIEQLDRFAVTGAGGFSGEFGIKVEVAMWGGVPVIAAARAGIRAMADATAKLEFEAGGRLDLTRTVPVWGEEPKVVSKDGLIYLNLVGTGELSAALAAFVGYEFFTFKGDLYQLVIAKATLAKLELGANFGVRYQAGKREFFVEPVEKDYVNFDWLFGKLWKARKLDAAKAEATDKMADLAALEDLSSQDDVQGYLEDLERGGGALHVANGKLQLLLNEEQVLMDVMAGERASMEDLQEQIDGRLQEQNIEAKKSFFQFRDIPELRKARKDRDALEKNLERNQKRVDELAEEKRLAQKEFIDSLKGADLDARINAAREKANDIYFKNLIAYNEERTAQTQEHEDDIEALGKTMKEQDARIGDLKARLADEATAGKFRAELQAAKDAEGQLAVALGRLTTETDAKRQQVEASVPTKKSGFFSRKNAEEKAHSDLKKELSGLEKQLERTQKDLTKATEARTKLAAQDPQRALEQQLAKAEAHKKLLHKRLLGRLEDAQKDRAEQVKLLSGSGVGKARQKRDDPSASTGDAKKDRPVHPLAQLMKDAGRAA